MPMLDNFGFSTKAFRMVSNSAPRKLHNLGSWIRSQKQKAKSTHLKFRSIYQGKKSETVKTEFENNSYRCLEKNCFSI